MSVDCYKCRTQVLIEADDYGVLLKHNGHQIHCLKCTYEHTVKYYPGEGKVDGN